MDGTLVTTTLDFAQIRRNMGLTPDQGILEAISEMPQAQQERATQYLLSQELESAKQAQLLPGAADIVSKTQANGLRCALLTRNTRRAADIVLRKFESLKFDLVRCREDGVIKPEPDGIFQACGTLGIDPTKTICVGDFEYDIDAANSAGAVSVLLTTSPDWQNFAHKADYIINSMDQLAQIANI